MAVPTTVITIVKDFTYRGVAGEEWSNTYMLSGTTPADSAAWRTLFDAIVAEEKKVYTSNHRVTRAYGYDKVPEKGDNSVWQLDLRPSATTVAGTLTATSVSLMAGDQAGWIRWSLNRFNTYGKRGYLRKYLHGGTVSTSTPDSISTSCKTAYDAFATFMMGGTLSGSRTIVDKLGNVPVAGVGSN